ncbi:ATP-binding protein [Streptomyces sp. NPDC047108]|uniref:ATP-binding protein n=1 Tax=Streptomyces sp. NPDC047108 TaxID=3155025 RepID=UPI0033FB716A
MPFRIEKQTVQQTWREVRPAEHEPVATPQVAAETWIQNASATAPREARTHIVEQLTAWGLEATGDDLELLVSELVTNGYQHVADCAHLRMQLLLDARSLTVCVCDEGGGEPDLRHDPIEDDADVDALRTGGYGLLLMRQLSSACGVETYDGATTVWFRLPRPPDRRFPDSGAPEARAGAALDGTALTPVESAPLGPGQLAAAPLAIAPDHIAAAQHGADTPSSLFPAGPEPEPGPTVVLTDG